MNATAKTFKDELEVPWPLIEPEDPETLDSMIARAKGETKMNERKWKNLNNEGGEGYNPAEIARKEREDAGYWIWVAEEKAREHALVDKPLDYHRHYGFFGDGDPREETNAEMLTRLRREVERLEKEG